MPDTTETTNTQARLATISQSLSAGAFVRVRKLLHDIPQVMLLCYLSHRPLKHAMSYGICSMRIFTAMY